MVAGSGNISTYGQLVNYLLVNYNPQHPPPTLARGMGTNVKLGLNLNKVLEMDMSHAQLYLYAWLRMSWHDPRLAWDPAEHDGIDVVSIAGQPPGKPSTHDSEWSVWTPDVELVNGEASLYDLPRKDVMVFSDGSCFWSRPGTLKTSCTMEGLQDFPFDRMMCHLKFQGWTLDDRYQNLTFYSPPWATEKVPKVSFQQFHLRGVMTSRVVESYQCCPGGWPFLDFTLQIERSKLYCELAALDPPTAVYITSRLVTSPV